MTAQKKIDQNEIKLYLKEIEHHLKLTNSPEETKRTLKLIQESIQEFIEDHPSASLEDFKDHFGDIDDFRDTVLYEVNGETLEKKIVNTNFIKKGLVFMIILALLVSSTILGLYIKTYLDLHAEIASYEITEIK